MQKTKRLALMISVVVAVCLHAVGASSERPAEASSHPIQAEHLTKLQQALEEVHSKLTNGAAFSAYRTDNLTELQHDVLVLHALQYETLKRIDDQYYSKALSDQGEGRETTEYCRDIDEALNPFVALSRLEYHFQQLTGAAKTSKLAEHLGMAKELALYMQQYVANAFESLINDCMGQRDELSESDDDKQELGAQVNRMVDIFAQLVPILHRNSELVGKLQQASSDGESVGPAKQAFRYHDFVRRTLWGNIKLLICQMNDNEKEFNQYVEPAGKGALAACMAAIAELNSVDITDEMFDGSTNDYSEYALEHDKSFDLYTKRYLEPLMSQHPEFESDEDGSMSNCAEVEEELEHSKATTDNMLVIGAEINILDALKQLLASEDRTRQEEAMIDYFDQEIDKVKAAKELITNGGVALSSQEEAKALLIHLNKLENMLDDCQESLENRLGEINLEILDWVTNEDGTLNILTNDAIRALSTRLEYYELWKRLYNEQCGRRDQLKISTTPALPSS